MIYAKGEVERLERYVAPLEGRRSLLRLDFNENTVGPSPQVIEAIRRLPPTEYATYPEYAGLNEAYASYLGIDPRYVAAFNGADAAIHAIFDAFGERRATLLTTSPTFGYYRPCALQQGMVVEEVLYPPNLDYPVVEIGQRMRNRPRLFFVCNPNNPTGTLLAPSRILELAAESPETLVVVDELYVPFTRQSVIPSALEAENIIVLQSLSKAAGLAGLRIGFALGHPYLVERISRVTGPYDINTVAVTAAKAALSDSDYIDRYVEEVLTAKAWTVNRLHTLGIPYFAGGGNYILVWPPGDGDRLVDALKREGILVRSMKGKPVIDGSFRLTIGTQAQMETFMAVFARLIGK